MKRLGLAHPSEALLCVPASYSDLRHVNTTVPSDDDEERVLYQLRFSGEMRAYDAKKVELDLHEAGPGVWRQIRRLELILQDRAGRRVNFSTFSDIWSFRDLQAGALIPMVGKVVHYGRKGAFLTDTEVPAAGSIGKIWVKYLGITGIVAGEKVEAMVKSQLDNPEALKHCVGALTEALGMPGYEAMVAAGLVDQFRSYEQLLLALHAPASIEEAWFARAGARKLAAMSVQVAALRHNLRQPHELAPLGVRPEGLPALAQTQREALTDEQLGVALKIIELLNAKEPMNALLSGDVGTGKTLTFLLPAILAHQQGARVAIMAPTTILADQLASQVIKRFGSVVSGVERVEAGGKIQDPQSILVGTPGLVTVAKKRKYIPNLLICDEQHKMSTEVRESLVGPHTHVLEVSATPVPRSLAAVHFGGKQILNLRKCPVEKSFTNFVGGVATDRPRFSAMLKWALDQGHRAAVVYPRVAATKPAAPGEEAPARVMRQEDEVATVESGARALEAAFPGKVVAIHGGMKDADITRALASVRDGSKPLVVASTVIETGVDIPSIAAMVVRDADRFGISQLHQLRGRLVRNGGVGYFAMMVQDLGKLDPSTLGRLQAVERTSDGFELAEKDLENRGFGDLAGGSQSGGSEAVFKLVRLTPRDYLDKKLSMEDVMAAVGRREEGRDAADEGDAQQEQAQEIDRRSQPRLFG